MEKKDNKLLAELLLSNGLVLDDDVIVEYIERVENAISLHPGIDKYTKLVYSSYSNLSRNMYGDVCQIAGRRDFTINFISSVFDNKVTDLNDKFLPNSAFSFGVCTKEDEEYEERKFALKKYQKELVATGIQTYAIDEKLDDGHKVYILSNRRKK